MRALHSPALAWIAVLACVTLSHADDSPTPQPRVALVLSGGGARGAAHAGALKVLEELRVPVDYVVGTSMGAIVGGLYASGVSPDAIEAELCTIDWNDLFDDSPPRTHLPLRRKQEDWQELWRMELGFGKHGLEMPRGLIAGQKLELLLASMMPDAALERDFDTLPVPFRAVATDLDSGEMVVLSDGTLGEAMRASMAVPGMFTPAVVDGRALIDGGVVRSLPVDVARALGADIVIAVDISPGPDSPDRSQSAAGVVLQTLYLLLDQNVGEQRATLGDQDVLILPDLGTIWVEDFPMAREAIAAGVEATRGQADALARYSVSESEFEQYRHRLRGARPTDRRIPPVDRIDIVGLSRVSPEAVRAVVRARAGEPIDPDRLADDLERVYGLGDFERVGLRVSEKEGTRSLVVDAREKPWGPASLRLGVTVLSDLRKTSTASMRAAVTVARLNPFGGEWRTLAQAGEEPFAMTEFYQPLARSGAWFVCPQLRWSRTRHDVYDGPDHAGQYDVNEFQGNIAAGIQFRNHAEIRLGLFRGIERADVLYGTPELEMDCGDIGGYMGRFVIDEVDSPSFPRSGVFLSCDALASRKGMGAEESWEKGHLDSRAAMSAGNHTALGVLELGSAFDSDIPHHQQFTLGGFMRLSGVESGRLRGPHMGFAEVAYYYRLVRLPGPSGRGIFAGGSLEAGNVWQTREAAREGNLRTAASIFVGADTILGPACVAFGWTEGGGTAAHLCIGGAFRS